MYFSKKWKYIFKHVFSIISIIYPSMVPIWSSFIHPLFILFSSFIYPLFILHSSFIHPSFIHDHLSFILLILSILHHSNFFILNWSSLILNWSFIHTSFIFHSSPLDPPVGRILEFPLLILHLSIIHSPFILHLSFIYPSFLKPYLFILHWFQFDTIKINAWKCARVVTFHEWNTEWNVWPTWCPRYLPEFEIWNKVRTWRWTWVPFQLNLI